MGFPRRIKRKEAVRSFKPIFYISCEGEKTELEYFKIVKQLLGNIPISINIEASRSSKGSAPQHVLAHMKNKLKDNRLQKGDEAWLVIDEDKWSEEQLQPLELWAKLSSQHGVTMSLPQFEAWLLQHFEKISGKISQQKCLDTLSKHIPNYSKSIPHQSITLEKIEDAIKREEERYQNLFPDDDARFYSVKELVHRMLSHRTS